MYQNRPELSIVVTSRNDDHGGNLLRRIQNFVNTLLEQCQQYSLKAEIVLVEWNPPQGRPHFSEALSWPVDKNQCNIRIIEVPPEIHKRFRYSDSLPFFQMIAKNVGIRRAHGNFILATNNDILFSDELIRFLASDSLKREQMYRVDRYDVPTNVPIGVPLRELLDYCKDNVIRIHRKDEIYNANTGRHQKFYEWALLYYKAPWLYNKIQNLLPHMGERLHTNACGDFTLMAREHWFAVRGYPEFEMYSMHLDSLLCHAAYYAGAREQILNDPMRIYHIEHSIGSGFTPEGSQMLKKRLDSAGIPQLSDRRFYYLASRMYLQRKPIIFNNKNWGLAKEDLTETTI